MKFRFYKQTYINWILSVSKSKLLYLLFRIMQNCYYTSIINEMELRTCVQAQFHVSINHSEELVINIIVGNYLFKDFQANIGED